MEINNYRLETFDKTVLKIIEFSKNYKNDLIDFKETPFYDFYLFIKNLPYRADPKNIETLSRPALTLNKNYSPRDCDDKTILICAFCELKKIPYKIVVTGKNKKFHHVFPQVFLNGNWIIADATYYY
jgi:hypothetical protein